MALAGWFNGRVPGLRALCIWVKGKYYENGPMARFLDAMNNIPLPSRGYVLTTELRGGLGRTPTPTEYRWLRDLVDGGAVPAAEMPSGVEEFLHRAQYRDAGHFLQAFDALFDAMVARVVELNRQALHELELNLLVFPQGTRSLRLSRGHTGLIQMAMHLGAAIVPVGCNGSDRVYPGNSPFAKGGRIVYRFGAPLEPDGPELAPYRIAGGFRPLSREVSRDHGMELQAATDVVMARINDLLDPPYQWAEDQSSDGVQGLDRFV